MLFIFEYKKIMILCVFFIAIDWLRYDLIRLVGNNGFNLVLGIILIALVVIYFLLLIYSRIYFFINYKSKKLNSLIPFMCLSLVFVYYFTVNNSVTYANFMYNVNKNNMEKTINMYEANELKQIGDDKFIAPYRLTSHNKIVYIDSENDIVTAVFFISNGYRHDRIVFYTDNNIEDIKLNNKYNYLNLTDIKAFDDKWYYVKSMND